MTGTGLNRRFLETTRGQIVTLLRRGACTVEELAQALGLTDNAVRNHLATLERDRIVRQRGVRRGGGVGKPAVIYELHPDAEPLFSRAYEPLLAAVLEVLVGELPAPQASEILHKVGRRLGAEVGNAATGTVHERAEAAAAVLRSLGGEVDVVTENGTVLLRGTACPLASIVARRPETCQAVEALVSEIIGSPAQECCAHGERPRCCFQIQTAA